MALLTQTPYKPQSFNHLKGLNGISDQTIEMHLALYNGYVTNTNKLTEELLELAKKGQSNTPAYAEMTRRLGFEYNGMILHEYYFGNLTPNGKGQPASGSAVMNLIEKSFGGWDAWLQDFKAVGAMRGVGWAIMFQDPMTGMLSNHWITLHQDGNPAGFKPILVMDVWEHAFLLDYKPAERGKYIEAFFSNIDWDAVNSRLQAARAERPVATPAV
jgi:Fe-Mn family superoxide dismutase